jgi:hypothetical protein
MSACIHALFDANKITLPDFAPFAGGNTARRSSSTLSVQPGGFNLTFI